MKVTIADSNRGMRLLTQQTLCFSPDVVTRANKMLTLTMSLASDQCLAPTVTETGTRHLWNIFRPDTTFTADRVKEPSRLIAISVCDFICLSALP